MPVQLLTDKPLSKNVYLVSIRLLNTLTGALQNAGLDLSQATISVQVDLGKRANRGLTSGTPTAKVITILYSILSTQLIFYYQ